METWNFSRDEIRTLILQSIDASWLPADEKAGLAASFQKDPSWRE